MMTKRRTSGVQRASGLA